MEILKPKSLYYICVEVSESEPERNEEIKFLPSTADGLEFRFRKLFSERNDKQNHNELVFIIDQMLRRDLIDRYDYTIANDMITGSGIIEKEEDRNP